MKKLNCLRWYDKEQQPYKESYEFLASQVIEKTPVKEYYDLLVKVAAQTFMGTRIHHIIDVQNHKGRQLKAARILEKAGVITNIQKDKPNYWIGGFNIHFELADKWLEMLKRDVAKFKGPEPWAHDKLFSSDLVLHTRDTDPVYLVYLVLHPEKYICVDEKWIDKEDLELYHSLVFLEKAASLVSGNLSVLMSAAFKEPLYLFNSDRRELNPEIFGRYTNPLQYLETYTQETVDYMAMVVKHKEELIKRYKEDPAGLLAQALINFKDIIEDQAVVFSVQEKSTRDIQEGLKELSLLYLKGTTLPSDELIISFSSKKLE